MILSSTSDRILRTLFPPTHPLLVLSVRLEEVMAARGGGGGVERAIAVVVVVSTMCKGGEVFERFCVLTQSDVHPTTVSRAHRNLIASPEFLSLCAFP